MNKIPLGIPPELHQKYVASIPEKIKKITELINSLKNTINKKDLVELRIEVHKLAGSAGTYGFDKISVISKQFETDIIQKLEEFEKGKSDRLWIRSFEKHFDQIKEIAPTKREA